MEIRSGKHTVLLSWKTENWFSFLNSDTLAGRGLNLYCLISPNSFSCANLVPWAFKEDGSVTLLGKVSGGGSCLVRPKTTAWGT